MQTNHTNTSLADQTPTPTRLIRNCDEVGLFDDLHLQHVNPFDETFRRAVESKSTATTPNLQNNGDDDDNHSHHMLLSDVLKCTAAAEESLHTPHVLPFYDDCRYRCIAAVSDATTSAHPDDVSFNRSGGVTEQNVTGETAVSTKTLTVICRKRKLLKQTSKPINVLIKSVPPIEVKDAHPVAADNEAENITKFVKIVPKVTTISKPHLQRFTKSTPPLDQPKSSEEPVKSVRQKLKESILRSNKESATKFVIEPSRVAVLSSHVIKPSAMQSARKAPPKLTSHNKNVTTMTTVNDSKHKLFERNREASKRYRFSLLVHIFTIISLHFLSNRNKMKIWHDETFKKNKELEQENKRLNAELTQLKIFMLAHQDCSVTRAMAQGKSIFNHLQ